MSNLAEPMQLDWGARPPRAQRDAPSRPVSTRDIGKPFDALCYARVRREGAPNYSRGDCAPHPFRLHGFGLGLQARDVIAQAEGLGGSSPKTYQAL